MSQLSKTAGKLWAAMACEVSEDVILSEFAAFAGIIKAQMNLEIHKRKLSGENADSYADLSADYADLCRHAQKVIAISRRRDTQVAALNYASNISDVLSTLQDVTLIAVRWGLIDFEDSTRFGSYRVGSDM